MKGGLQRLEEKLSLTKYHFIISFILKTLAVLAFFFLLKFIHRVLIDPSSPLYMPVVKEMDIYSLFSDTITYPSKIFLSIWGHDSLIEGRVISIPGYRGVEIQAPCMGFDVFATFIALTIAYPSKAKIQKTILFILSGILLIHLLNILRVSALLIRNRYGSDLSLNHHTLFNFIIYSFVLVMFYFWVKINSSSANAEGGS